MDNLEKELESEVLTEQGEEQPTITEFILPCKPGDEVWCIERLTSKTYHVKKDIVKMVGFTSSDVQITFEGFQFIGSKPYIWNKNVFATEEAAKEALKEKTRRAKMFPQHLVELIEKFKNNAATEKN